MNLVTIASSYIIRNCLPFNLEITLLKTKEKYLIAKSEKLFIDSFSLEDSLSVNIRLMNFKNKEEIFLYKTKKDVK